MKEGVVSVESHAIPATVIGAVLSAPARRTRAQALRARARALWVDAARTMPKRSRARPLRWWQAGTMARKGIIPSAPEACRAFGARGCDIEPHVAGTSAGSMPPARRRSARRPSRGTCRAWRRRWSR